MKIHKSIGCIIGISLLFTFCVSAQDSLYKLDNPFSATYVQSKLRKQLPRLVLDTQLEKNLRKKIKSDTVVQNLYTAIKLNAENVLKQPLINLDIPLEERSQNNQLDISRDMLYRVNMLAMVYRIEKDKRMLERINEEVIAACNFPSWNSKHFLDVGEMALAIAIAIDWTAGDLPQSTIDLAKKALIEKGINPSWPEGGDHSHWAFGTSNWNQVCNGGMIAASIAIAEVDPELATKTIHRAIEGMQYALNSYGPDGVYPEGATYWRYGTSFTVISAAMFESAFGTDFGIYEYPAFKESAIFKKLCMAPSGMFYNFGDCGEKGRPNGDMILAWFASKTGNKSFFDAQLFMNEPEAMGELPRLSGISLVWIAQYEEKDELAIPSVWKGGGPNPVVFFTGGENAPNQYYFGGKGGKGNMSHGNLDAGSFVFELYGERWSVDLGKFHHYGVVERTGFDLWSRCQKCDRWKLINTNNLGHSTITVDNKLHAVDGKAIIIDFKDGKRPETTLDMSPVFAGQLKCAYRKFVKDSPTSLLIEDSIVVLEKTEWISWQLMTQADVELFTGGAILTQGGKRLKLEILSHPQFTPSVVSLDPPPLALDLKKEGLKRLEIRCPAWAINGDQLNIKVRLAGLEK